MTIDWTKPIEHIDGTPLVLNELFDGDNGADKVSDTDAMLGTIRDMIAAVKNDPQLLADIREMLSVNDTYPQDTPSPSTVLYARPSNGCSYITAGKLYRVHGGVVDGGQFDITDDDGDNGMPFLEDDPHTGGSWDLLWLPEGSEKC